METHTHFVTLMLSAPGARLLTMPPETVSSQNNAGNND